MNSPVIAKRKRAIDGGQTYDSIEWLTADPVTGTEARFIYTDLGTARATEEQEPLGQQVFAQDPAEFPDPPPNEMVSFWEDMQWQCEAGNDFYGGFVGMPFHCQMAVLRNFSGDIPWETPPAEKKESDPKKIPDHEDDGGQPSDQFSLSQAVTSAALTSTMKFTADDDIYEDDEPPIDMGGAFAPRWRTVSMPDDFKDASFDDDSDMKFFGIDENDIGGIGKAILDALTEECEAAFKAAGLITISEQVNKGVTFVSEEFFSNRNNDPQWAPNTDFASGMRVARNYGGNTLDVTHYGEYQGRYYVGFTGRALNDNQTDDYFEVIVVHALIHSGGKRGSMKAYNTKTTVNARGEEVPISSTYPKHDLEHMGDEYNRIIKHCTRKGESKAGTARGII